MTDSLHGRRVLVVEDEYMIAQEIAGALEDVGAEPAGPVPSVRQAMQLIAAGGLDAALLDVNLGLEAVWPVVDALQSAHIPLVLATGYDESAIPLAYLGLPRCQKPTTGRELVRAVTRVLAGA